MLRGWGILTPQSLFRSTSLCPYLPMECNSCVGERLGGLAQTPLPDPVVASAHLHPTPPPSQRLAGLLKGSSTKKVSQTHSERLDKAAAHCKKERERREEESQGQAVLKRRAQREGKWSRRGEQEAG